MSGSAKGVPRRLDALLVERGLAESREQARKLILAGAVRVADQLGDKASRCYAPDAPVTLRAAPRFVSRGGEKLAALLDACDIDVAGCVALDVGASTGGFTDCLLRYGAARVIAMDVGHGQLHWRLRNDPRVTNIEHLNARLLQASDLPECPGLAVIDVSFISLRSVMPAIVAVLPGGADLVTLVKPQFEAGRANVGKGGVVRDPDVRERVIETIRRFGCETLGLQVMGMVTSPLHGPRGNIETLIWWRTPVCAPRKCNGEEPTAEAATGAEAAGGASVSRTLEGKSTCNA